MNITKTMSRVVLLLAACIAGSTLAGCENKETLLDAEGPRGEIEIERDRDTGQVDVEIDRNE